mmetsp:Transcript_96579/g.249719  ORF Transcript_96579/g.249719 Transcript_96579/m.249719 type:complete len:432 (+) Transcript_96579:566-1861(+)
MAARCRRRIAQSSLLLVVAGVLPRLAAGGVGDAACAPEGADPLAGGGVGLCCEGLTKTLGLWMAGQPMSYLCVEAPTAAPLEADLSSQGLLGEYGFLTQFGHVGEEEARQRVRNMTGLFNIREFQFYDAMQGYSEPPEDSLESWYCLAFNRFTLRKTIRTYTDEIASLGGRSWLYVQAMAADPGDHSAVEGAMVVGQHIVDGKPLLDIVVPTTNWALRIARKWASFAKKQGFSGIHWDTLGDLGGNEVLKTHVDLPGFLRAALPVLLEQGLSQTMNFVDGFGWDLSLLEAPKLFAFPYWEVWTVPKNEDKFFNEVTPDGGGVFVCYPGKTAIHTGESQNQHAIMMKPVDLLIARWVKAKKAGNTYLAIGDGARRIQTEYFPDTAALTEAEVTNIQNSLGSLSYTTSTVATTKPNLIILQVWWMTWVGTLAL